MSPFCFFLVLMDTASPRVIVLCFWIASPSARNDGQEGIASPSDLIRNDAGFNTVLMLRFSSAMEWNRKRIEVKNQE
ncbi:MAG: hypothetical protein RR386_04785 [Bacteroidaceae bacterium]